MKKFLKSYEIMTEWWLMMWNLGKFINTLSMPEKWSKEWGIKERETKVKQ